MINIIKRLLIQNKATKVFPKNQKELIKQIENFKNIKNLDFNKYNLESKIDNKFNIKDIPFNEKKSFENLNIIKKEYDTAVMNDYLFNKNKINIEFENIIKNFLNYISDKDENINFKGESNFLKYIVDLKKNMKNKNFEINMNIDNLKIEILEKTHISGAFVERSYNPYINNIFLYNNDDNNGLFEYKIKNNSENSILYRINDIEKEMILRVNILIKGITDFEIKENGKYVKKIKDKNHLITIENQLNTPIQEVLMYNQSLKYIMEYYRLNEWKIVDFDGIFCGNNLFQNSQEENYVFNYNN